MPDEVTLDIDLTLIRETQISVINLSALINTDFGLLEPLWLSLETVSI